MFQELSSAGAQLCSALDRYVRACSNVRLDGNQLNNSPELLKILEKELTDIASHITRMENARSAISTARNHVHKLAPVTALPAEILARIFYFVLPGQSCAVQRSWGGNVSQVKYPSQPDSLAHVCSFWRRVAMTCSSLWTHIDIVLDHSLNPGLSARAKIYATRAGQLPLEIHISDPGSRREENRRAAIKKGTLSPEDPSGNPNYNWDDLHDFKFLDSGIALIRKLQIDLRACGRLREIYYSVLEYFFAHCKPGVLSEYIVRCVGWYEPSNPDFIETTDIPYSRNSALLAVPSYHLEELWLQMPIVRVNGLCPHWKSKAYHALVELCIDIGAPEMTELQLINILRLSPKLQVLRVTMPLEDLIDDQIIDPVHLEDLQDLNLMIQGDIPSCTTANHILRRIAPGLKSLQLSLFLFAQDNAVDFLSRANVTRLFIFGAPPLGFLFDTCPRLEILVLQECGLGVTDLETLTRRVATNFGDQDSDGENRRVYRPVSTSAAHIDTLYLLQHSEFAFEEIQAVVEGYSVQRLFIYEGGLSYQTDEGRTVCDNVRNIRAKLSTIIGCPIIEYYPDSDALCDEGFGDSEGWIHTSLKFVNM